MLHFKAVENYKWFTVMFPLMHILFLF